jgi:hypothetical protein
MMVEAGKAKLIETRPGEAGTICVFESAAGERFSLLGLLYEESDPARAVEMMSVLVAYEREIGHPDAEADAERVAQIQARLEDQT